jgi:hypothetical protein
MGGAFLASRVAMKVKVQKDERGATSAQRALKEGELEGSWRPTTICIEPSPDRGGSLADSKSLDDTTVTLNILALQVVQKPTALSYELQQSPARMMILLMYLEVIREVSDALTQEGDLNLG